MENNRAILMLSIVGVAQRLLGLRTVADLHVDVARCSGLAVPLTPSRRTPWSSLPPESSPAARVTHVRVPAHAVRARVFVSHVVRQTRRGRRDNSIAAGIGGSPTVRVARRTFKIMSVICHSVPGGMAGHVATRRGTRPSEYWDVMTAGGTGQHEI